ncbi:hypothetical protein UFOVP38_54 [uncultured Caudovirales phage]|uniref:Uncharacterized protein n=1 Tax=uncultured Caudovirales phage TaxID=2100421 RepID=A0A6J5T950_9CAUD|nr:hypothetical protein UFOVP38_54 [uncultured Caudovirales phage]
MIEFSFTELVLLVWAIGATAAAFHYKEKKVLAAMLLHRVIDNTKLYGDMRDQWLKFKGQNNA